MGHLLSWRTTSSSTGVPGDASTRTRRQSKPPPKAHKLTLGSTRTSIDSPGLITSVGYIPISGRSAVAQHGAIRQGAAVGSRRPPLVSYPAGPVNSRPSIVQSLGTSLSRRANVPSPAVVPISSAVDRASLRPPPREANAVTDTRTFATGPPVSALTTRPPNSTVTVGVAVIPGTGDGPPGGLLQPGVMMTTATPRLAMTTRARALLRIMSRR